MTTTRKTRRYAIVTHLAAPYTFAQDGRPACRNDGDSQTFIATHTLNDVTCKKCPRTAEFRRAASLGLRENDERWETT